REKYGGAEKLDLGEARREELVRRQLPAAPIEQVRDPPRLRNFLDRGDSLAQRETLSRSGRPDEKPPDAPPCGWRIGEPVVKERPPGRLHPRHVSPAYAHGSRRDPHRAMKDGE